MLTDITCLPSVSSPPKKPTNDLLCYRTWEEEEASEKTWEAGVRRVRRRRPRRFVGRKRDRMDDRHEEKCGRKCRRRRSHHAVKRAPSTDQSIHTPRRGRSSLGANSFIKYCPSCKTVSPSHTHTLPMHTLPFVVANIAVVQFEVPAKKAARTFYMKLGGGLTTVCLGSVRRHVKNVLFCWSERH